VGDAADRQRGALGHRARAHDGLADVAVDLVALPEVFDARAHALDDPRCIDPDDQREAVLHVVLHEPGHDGDVGLVHPRDLDGDDDLAFSWLWIWDLADAPRLAECLDRERAHGFPPRPRPLGWWPAARGVDMSLGAARIVPVSLEAGRPFCRWGPMVRGHQIDPPEVGSTRPRGSDGDARLMTRWILRAIPWRRAIDADARRGDRSAAIRFNGSCAG
jgi:hypothetical protein